MTFTKYMPLFNSDKSISACRLLMLAAHFLAQLSFFVCLKVLQKSLNGRVEEGARGGLTWSNGVRGVSAVYEVSASAAWACQPLPAA